ncbi:MAG: M28 family peptidase [Gemmatimonadota bacterium]
MRSRLSLATASFLLLAVACGRDTSSSLPREFDGAAALKSVETQVAFGPRIPGTAPHAAMAHWLDSLVRTKTDSVVLQRWWHHPAVGDSIEMINVIARVNPAATNRVLYLAHWDTRPRSDGPTSIDKVAPVPGANDGGSGVAVLLGVLDALKKQPTTVGVDLVFLDGEDYGFFGPPRVDVLIGSEYYAKNPIVAEKPSFAVLWDMVGDKDLRIPKEPGSQVAAPDVVDRVWSVAAQMGYGHIFVDASYGGPITDDHTPLIAAGFKAIDIIDIDYGSWHTKHDTPDKLSKAALEAVGNVAVGVIRGATK